MLGGLIAACLLAADGPEVTALGPARADGLLRLAVRQPGLESPGPVQVQAELRAGGTVIAEASATIAEPSSLAAGIVLVLAPDQLGSGPLRARAILTMPGRAGASPRIVSAETAVDTPATALLAASTAAAELRRRGIDDPLPWLWAEQAAELLAGGASAASANEMSVIAERMQRWLDGWRPTTPGAGSSELALRDPIDGSVQPWRLHLPPGPGPHPVAVVLATPAHGISKVRWPDADGRLLTATLESGVAVIVCYPAGDRSWRGAASRRVAATIARAASLARLDTSRGVTICDATPAAPPYRVERSATAIAADASWWKAVLGPPLPPTPSAEPGLAAYAAAPFTVVVGTGEHAAARAANRRLAAAFRAAWAAHAHGLPPEVDDTADPATVAGRNLVLIGNPRSNRMLAAAALSLPVIWDHRSVSGPDGFSALRASAPVIALAARLADGRAALILDGADPPWGSGLPLADLPPRLLQSR